MNPKASADKVSDEGVKNEFKDLGFGTKLATQEARLLNRDGSFNVERRGLPRLYAINVYQEMINLSWRGFVVAVLCFYVVVNFLVSFLYLAIGTQHLVGMDRSSTIGRCWDAL